MSNHVYWGLMEGLTVPQICQAVGLAGCYCGLPTYVDGILVIHKTLRVLKGLIAAGDCRSTTVLRTLTREFTATEI